MLILYPQGTNLTLEKAHWIQILHTAAALGRCEGVRVVVIPRTAAPERLDKMESDLGERLPKQVYVEPLIEYSRYKKWGVSGNLLTRKQKMFLRWYGIRRFAAIARKHHTSGEEVLLYTRDQEIPKLCRGILRKLKAKSLNELHKFESVNRLQAFIEENKKSPLKLGVYRRFAEKERAQEFRDLADFQGVVCTTETMESHFKRSRKAPKIPSVVIENGTPLPAYVSEQEALGRQRDWELLYVGQLYRWKNVDLLLEALKLLPGRMLHIVGGKPGTEDWKRLNALAEKLEIVERVKFLGMQPHESIAGMMMRSQVGVVPLPLSGFPEARLFCCPLKALELMAAGTPIVASDLHAVRGLLKHSENAWLVKPDDAKALATGISEVLENQELRNRLIAGGLQSAQELSYDARARKILEFARSVG